MRRVKLLLPVMLLTAWSMSHTANAEETLEIGIFPYMSTQAMLTLYYPLQNYLEMRLQKPVLLVTAHDQKTFVERTQKGEYRFVITGSNFARLAQVEAGYVPMLRPKSDQVGIFVVNKNSSMRSISELRGKTVTLPPRISIIAMLSLQSLRNNGLEPGRDITVHYALSHNSAALDVLRGESSAAGISAIVLPQMPAEIRNNVKILATTGKVPPLIILANPKVSSGEITGMTSLIMDFAERTPEGAQFINKLSWHGLRPPTDKEMRSLDPYVSELTSSPPKDRKGLPRLH